MHRQLRNAGLPGVALLAEGVGRNCNFILTLYKLYVALLAEGVGRNQQVGGKRPAPLKSPSSRRAWVEILAGHSARYLDEPVALLAEGVGRNQATERRAALKMRRPPRGGRG